MHKKQKNINTFVKKCQKNKNFRKNFEKFLTNVLTYAKKYSNI